MSFKIESVVRYVGAKGQEYVTEDGARESYKLENFSEWYESNSLMCDTRTAVDSEQVFYYLVENFDTLEEIVKGM